MSESFITSQNQVHKRILESQNSSDGFKAPKPFLKWAGGKTQLIPEIEKRLPAEIFNKNFTYVEPFVGSGAVLFWMLNRFPNLEKAIINDVNQDLINVYNQIKTEPQKLIEVLKDLQKEFHALDSDEEKKKAYYYDKRDCYNTRQSEKSVQAALFIFLNRTCFNGLYRVNRKNFFNVPMGSHKCPTICDEQNILSVSKALQIVEIIHGDFEQTEEFANENSFFYFDPPYKPLNVTSSFNSYSDGEFNDTEQIRLRDFCFRIDKINCKWILSNSDVQNDNLLNTIYKNFIIERVKAKRVINSKAEKRGELNELLITNFKHNNNNLVFDNQQPSWNEQTQ